MAESTGGGTAAVDSYGDAMINYKLTIAYEGTRYRGWQAQGNTDMTVQGKLQAALSKMCGYVVEINGSGRTDAGVHARGQTANFKLKEHRGSSGAFSCQTVGDAKNVSLPDMDRCGAGRVCKEICDGGKGNVKCARHARGSVVSDRNA